MGMKRNGIIENLYKNEEFRYGRVFRLPRPAEAGLAMTLFLLLAVSCKLLAYRYGEWEKQGMIRVANCSLIDG